MTSRITKNELVAINATLAAENAALRAQLSVAKVTLQSDTNNEQHLQDCGPSDYVVNDSREHEYDTVREAMDNCRKLVAWDTARRYMFVVRGNKVICKIRAAH